MISGFCRRTRASDDIDVLRSSQRERLGQPRVCLVSSSRFVAPPPGMNNHPRRRSMTKEVCEDDMPISAMPLILSLEELEVGARSRFRSAENQSDFFREAGS